MEVVNINTKKVVDLSPVIFSVLFKLSIVLIVLTVSVDLYFENSINFKGLVPPMILLVFSIYNLKKKS